ncbi:hypothetical protein ACIQU5_06340 [Streptomyces sp. NPDC090306]|uniref:hypothetical protein n=1 Tax=unclassified Streptomyces TaxID=2593676 RepID=UPI0036ED8D8C
MPRPTAAQLAYGSCTVIISTLAMLLLSQTSSGVGIAVIALAALALGLLVSVTVPMPKQSRATAQSALPRETAPRKQTVTVPAAPRRAETVREMRETTAS